MVSVSGEAYISEMNSAFGEEATKVLKYEYVEIEPGESESLNLGYITEFTGWHYHVVVHISWNGGSIELSELLIPTS